MPRSLWPGGATKGRRQLSPYAVNRHKIGGGAAAPAAAAATSVAKFKRGGAYPDFTMVSRTGRQAIAKALQDAAAQVHKAAPLMG